MCKGIEFQRVDRSWKKCICDLRTLHKHKRHRRGHERN